jgi:peptidoglycan/LPS O-acetylase OafA/YrhL
MGTLRLVLALAVLLSHADARLFGFNQGVIAVIGFYLISGYMMAGLLHRHYATPGLVPLFYADRALRLFPQYLLYAGITLAWQLWGGERTLFLTREPGATDLLNNLLLVPLNYYMYNGADGYMLIPPGWSLGAELQFYLLVPFMALWPRLGLALAALSVAVHVLALHGVLNTDWFGYRLLPGVLWVFAAGMLMFHWHRASPKRAAVLAWGAPVAALLVLSYLRARGLHAAPYHQEVLAGWALGLPLLHWLARRSSDRWDELAGDLAYGVFLNHFLLIWLFFPQPGRTPLQWAALALCSVALSFVSQRVLERPVLSLRRRMRKRPERSEIVT